MQTIFSKVLKAFDEEQAKRYGEPMEQTNGTTVNYSLPASRSAPLERTAAAQIPPENLNSSDRAENLSRSRDGKTVAIQTPAESSFASLPPLSSTRKSRRQSSRRDAQSGVKSSSDEGLMSLTYSYGSMDWDAIEMCWKPKKGPRKRKSNSSKAGGSSAATKPAKKSHTDPVK
ncbi:MAG: hypothetical protein SGBAC_008098 [Bacillariaceae sp.]